MKQEENDTLVQHNSILCNLKQPIPLQQLNIQFRKGEKDTSLQYINSKRASLAN
jgi:hypothetical protein